MKFPGQILAEHRWIVLFAALVVLIGIFSGANRSAYEEYRKSGPDIWWENIPSSALTFFLWNMRNALLSLLGIVLALFSAFGIGFSLGVGFWIISQNPLGIIGFSHGILEIYSAFLGVVGGLIIMVKIGEALWVFFSKFAEAPHFVNWKEVAEEYVSLFLFSVIGLFASAWMEAILGYAILYAGFLLAPISIVNTLISLLTVSYFSSSAFRTLVTGKTEFAVVSTRMSKKKIPEVEKLFNGVWCVCPKCGAYISADVEYCTCGAELPKKRKD